MLVYFPKKCDHGFAETSRAHMVCWFQVNVSGMGQLVATPYRLGADPGVGSKLHRDPITRKHNTVNIGNGKQIEQGCGGFAQG